MLLPPMLALMLLQSQAECWLGVLGLTGVVLLQVVAAVCAVLEVQLLLVVVGCC